jgi:RNA polymerase sigma factor (sigma-70 family)
VALWDASKRILFAVARRVRLAIRLELEGFGRDEAEAEELVNDAFVCLCEAMPRFDPAKARLTTFVYALARRRMWLVARAAFFGLSPEAMHAADTSRRTPRWHHGHPTLRGTAARQEQAERRLSVLRVEAIRQRLPRKDKRLLDVYLQEGGNRSAVARRLGMSVKSIHGRYLRLFRRIRRIAV